MPTLTQSLQGRDRGFLILIAEHWGIEIDNQKEAIQQLNAAMLDSNLAVEVYDALPPEGQAALQELLANGGKLRWQPFSRHYGIIREMGPTQRDRLQPHRKPETISELLFYRGFIGMSIFDTAEGPQEHIYIPSELINLLPSEEPVQKQSIGRPASPDEHRNIFRANDRIIDHATTMLAAYRMGLDEGGIKETEDEWEASYPAGPYPMTISFMNTLLTFAGMIDETLIPIPDVAKDFLEDARGNALAGLFQAWLSSEDCNDLRMIPGLVFEGEWQNEPRSARLMVLERATALPAKTWWHLPTFIRGIKEQQPDFQRPAGDYDSWYIRDEESGEFLRGFENWEAVEGQLIRYLITGPMHWLGLIDLATSDTDGTAIAFRRSAWSNSLLNNKPLVPQKVKERKAVVTSDAHIHMHYLTPRLARYQIARFCSWDGEKDGTYFYHVSPNSLERAREQGLKISHLLSLLQRYGQTIPPKMESALSRWEKYGTEAHMEPALILRVRSPEILKALRASRAARFLGEPLGSTAIKVQPNSFEKVLAILAEIGFLGEIHLDD